MIWLVWRRQRAALLLALGLCVVVAVGTVVGRFVVLDVARDLDIVSCLRGDTRGSCSTMRWIGFSFDLDEAVRWIRRSLVVLPAVAGILAGAGLLSGGPSSGFALVQGTSQLRWWGAAVVGAGVPVAAAVGLTTAVATVAQYPFAAAVVGSPLHRGPFLTSGVLPAAYTLLAFGIAASAGLLLRSAPAAAAVALVGYPLVMVGITLAVLDGHLPPVTLPLDVGRAEEPVAPPGALTVDNGYLDRDGREVPDEVFAASHPCRAAQRNCLDDVGVVARYVRYQPESRYWTFQAIEGGIVLALATAGPGAVRRRAA